MYGSVMAVPSWGWSLSTNCFCSLGSSSDASEDFLTKMTNPSALFHDKSIDKSTCIQYHNTCENTPWFLACIMWAKLSVAKIRPTIESELQDIAHIFVIEQAPDSCNDIQNNNTLHHSKALLHTTASGCTVLQACFYKESNPTFTTLCIE